MREDHLEALEKMFPRGYVITYVMPNNNPAYNWFNPLEDEFIEDYLLVLNHMFQDGEMSNEENSNEN